MKTIKALFAVLFLTTLFLSCAADSINDEVGIEEIDVIGEDENNDVEP